MADKTITHNGREIPVVSMGYLVGELTPEAKAERFRKIAGEIDAGRVPKDGDDAPATPSGDKVPE